MKKTHVLMAATMLLALSAGAATTGNLVQGVCINEIMPDPNYSGSGAIPPALGFDTDGNLETNTEDEYVEIYNTTGTPVNITGWELWDGDNDTTPFHVFPATTMLPANGTLAVMNALQSGGSLPTNVVEATGSMSLSNGGDSIYLTDSTNYIGMTWNGASEDLPTNLPGTLVGSYENFGSDVDGNSVARYPDGDTNVINTQGTNGAVDVATPGALNTSSLPVELDEFGVE